MTETTPTIDGHADTFLSVLDDEFCIGQRNESGHLDIPRLREGNVDAQFFACWVNPEIDKGRYVERVLHMLDEMHRATRENGESLRFATSSKDIREATVSDCVAAIPCVEGGHAIRESLRVLRNFYRLGVRYMTLTWMNDNEWADGSGGNQTNGGLTEFGEDVVKEMNRLGMIVDLSHVSIKTLEDAIKQTRAPVLASHSCCRAIHDHHRNLTDKQLEMLRDNGGVIGICFYPGFLSKEYADQLEEYLDEQAEDEESVFEELPESRRPYVGVDTLVDHIEHAVKVAGIDHVGIGSDFDGVKALPREIPDCSRMNVLREELRDRGFDQGERKKIMGGNILRVFEEVEKISENQSARTT